MEIDITYIDSDGLSIISNIVYDYNMRSCYKTVANHIAWLNGWLNENNKRIYSKYIETTPITIQIDINKLHDLSLVELYKAIYYVASDNQLKAIHDRISFINEWN